MYGNFSTSLRWRSNEPGRCLTSVRCIGFMCSYLSGLILKNPLAVSTQWRRNDRQSEGIRRCIPCRIPDPLSSQANYMFRNGHDVRCRSRTLCSHPRRKCTLDSDQQFMNNRYLFFYSTSSSFCFLNCALLEPSLDILCQ